MTERWEPTGVEGEPPRVSTVIRFDPVSCGCPMTDEGMSLLRRALMVAADVVRVSPGKDVALLALAALVIALLLVALPVLAAMLGWDD